MRTLLLLVAFAVGFASCSSDSDSWYEPIIPVSLDGIEAVNIDNSGEYPFITNSAIKKEAYAIGIRWITDNTPTPGDDDFITGPIISDGRPSRPISERYQKVIKCLTQFNEKIPPGSNISKFFKEIKSSYLPADINEGFVLLVAPNPGEHSFRVEYHYNEELKFSYETEPIKFY